MILIKRKVSFIADSKHKGDDPKLRHLRCVITWNGCRARINTGFRVNVDGWSKELQRCKARTTHGDMRIPASVINNALEEWEYEIDRVFKSFEDDDTIPTVSALKDAIRGRLNPDEDVKDNSIFPIYDKFLAEGIATERWKKSSIAKLKVIRGHLYKMSPTLTFDELDENGIKDLITYYNTKVSDKKNRVGAANYTITKTVAIIKSFVRWAVEKGYCNNTRFINQKTRLKSTTRPVIFLTWDELMRVLDFDFSDRPALGQVRDVFCFCCFTSLRYSDVRALKRVDIGTGTITVTTVKTDDRLTIELNKYSQAILDKYKDVPFPNGRALPIISNQKMNDYIKLVGQACELNTPIKMSVYKGTTRHDETFPKWQLLSTHAGRRTFISNALMLGIPPNVVMKWTGHSDYKAMKPYIEIADDAKRLAMSLFDNVKK